MCQFCDISFLGFAEPQSEMLASYADALRRGWSPNNIRDVSQDELRELEADPEAFIAARRDDAQTDGRTTTLPDGRVVPRLPSRLRWIWDGEFCGQIGLRWQPGSDRLPDYVLGHVGYGVVPWKRGHGLAKRALRHMLSEAREVGLRRLEITIDQNNVASRGAIVANGGTEIGTFVAPIYGVQPRVRFVITLA